MLTVIGFIGNLLLALCSIPLAYRAYREKSIQIDTLFLLVWSLGEILAFIYILSIPNWIIAMNYIVNILGLAVVWRYKK